MSHPLQPLPSTRPTRTRVGRLWWTRKQGDEQSKQSLLHVLMVPTMATIFMGAVFGVAVPTMRTEFGVEADMAAWLVTAQTLPFMLFMPLYGRLGDFLGKRNLLLTGLFIFALGTLIALIASNLAWFLAGRVIQGAGAAGIVPLSMAIISERFDSTERGKALGTWNSVGPAASIPAPFLAGYMIDNWGWRTIFIPVLIMVIVAIVIVWRRIPSLRDVRFDRLRSFDWGGVALLFGTISALIFYVSSRPITGVEPLRDWRFLAATLFFGTCFVFWERRCETPLIELGIFGNRSFRSASASSALRMFAMTGIVFLMPLYLTDVRGLSASATGSLLMLNAAALLVTMRAGGQLADRLESRWPVAVGMGTQAAVMAYFALLPGTVPLFMVAIGLICHGLGAGLALAALHRAALSRISREQTGAAAGVYSMIRFGGMLIGTALGGVLLQQSLARQGLVLPAYQTVYWCIAAVAATGALIGWQLND